MTQQTPLITALVLILSLGAVGCEPAPGHQVTSSATATQTTAALSDDEPAASAADETETPRSRQPTNAGVLDRLPDMIERTLPSVVGISTRRVVRMMPPRSPFGPFGRQRPQERMQEGMGSGVVVTSDGVILTNNHVIDGADEIVVRLSDDREFDAELIGADPKTDVAVVKLSDPPADLRPIEFGDSRSLRLGQPVVAIGNPFGLSSTVTLGIVSATGRANVGIVDYEDFIQTDAAINPGNSGGALVDEEGRLVGINTAILSRTGGYQGIGFAIPSNMARSIQERLVNDGTVTRGWLGVGIQTVTPELAEALEVPRDTRGVLVSDVESNSPAQAGGLQRGDVIVRIGEHNVANEAELRNAVALEAPGTTVAVEILRDGALMSRDVELGTLGGANIDASGALTLKSLDGATFAEPSQEFRHEYGISAEAKGVAVVHVEPSSVAARVGLRPGDMIVELNRQPVKTPAALSQAYEEAKRKVLMLVRRDGRTLFLAVPKR